MNVRQLHPIAQFCTGVAAAVLAIGITFVMSKLGFSGAALWIPTFLCIWLAVFICIRKKWYSLLAGFMLTEGAIYVVSLVIGFRL